MRSKDYAAERSYLDKLFLEVFGTVSPEDERVREIYMATQERLYPTKDGQAPERDKDVRRELMKVRRALETYYGWLRLDPQVREVERTTVPVREIDVINMPRVPGIDGGIVVLKRARPNGNNEIIEWERTVPEPEDRSARQSNREFIESLISTGGAPLNVLLGHLWHFKGVVDAETTVRAYAMRQVKGAPAPVLVPAGSAMGLSEFMTLLRRLPS